MIAHVDLGVRNDDGWCVIGWLDGLVGLAWASIEGTQAEMVLLGHAIETRGTYSAKRCAVDATEERVRLWSPRNHTGEPPTVSRADAARLAARIRAMDLRVERDPGYGPWDEGSDPEVTR